MKPIPVAFKEKVTIRNKRERERGSSTYTGGSRREIRSGS